ncbi:MAG: hypothetical protein KKE02_18095 [Alphaproteobacteria bacterium]|nr:hypothetical protein [Alphaproteobacteria bacterium]MBU1515212.1 hypothetical protein [Alphaproteobacteria bacterium]MBU2092342.1 hypothetical protein [Alphaproteobacteria bacterium]MBU2152936.1 hypothetical protein [Alphaproteobacteria bacterium]MBU2305767.1 hypothetical protein [Alphaproteobacteria bacterium]
MHGLVTERVRRFQTEAPDIAWSICEVFTDPPAELSPHGSPLAWHCIVKDGAVTFAATETDDVEFKVFIDYEAVVPLGRYDTRGDPARQAELGAMAQALRDAGKMRVIGDRSRRDPRVGDFHDLIARVTA